MIEPNILLMADRERFWAHLSPLVYRLRRAGAHVNAIVPWSDEHAQGLAAVVHHLYTAGAMVNILSPGNRHIRLPQLLGKINPIAAVLCPEHLEPMRQVKTLLADQGSACRVFAFQHGLWQRFTPDTPRMCHEFLAWGDLSRRVMTSGDAPQGVPVTITGTPKFDSYNPRDAEDHGFVLAHAPHVHGQPSPITVAWIKAMQAKVHAAGFGDRRLRIKAHCNDLDAANPSNVVVDPRDWVRPGVHSRDLIRTCSALYLDYPSTAWVEAQRYKKPVILDGMAREWLEGLRLADAVRTTHSDAEDNIMDAILPLERTTR